MLKFLSVSQLESGRHCFTVFTLLIPQLCNRPLHSRVFGWMHLDATGEICDIYYEHQVVDVPMYNHFHWNIFHLCLCTSIFSNIFSRKHQLPFHTCSCSNGFHCFLIIVDTVR